MRRVIPFAVLIAAVALALVYLAARHGKAGDRATSVRISGNIEAHESVVGFKVQGRTVELPVQEGQYLRRGDLIARLDTSDYDQQVAIDQAALQSRESELALARAGSRSQEINAAKQSQLDAQADLELKQTEYRRHQALYEKDEVSAATRDVSAANLKRAQAAYERSAQRYAEVAEGTRAEQIAIHQAGVQAAQANLGLARIRRSYATLSAPVSGVVTLRQAEIGEVVAPNTPVVTIADLDHLWLRGYLSETELGRVRLGQPAQVTVDSLAGKSFKGRVSFVSSQAEFTPKSVETHKERVTLVYRIKIDLENPGHELKPGMPADAEIQWSGR